MRWFHGLAASIAAVLMAGSAAPVAAADPPGLIFDTDMCGDCDDVLALSMIHSLQSRGACKLLAVTVTVDNEKVAPFVDLVNTFYGHGDIPIGVVGKGGVVEQGKYLPLVDAKDGDGKDRYPHDLRSGKDAPSATKVLRKVLAGQPDQSVVIAQVGFSTNLARLLASGPDDDSPLSGVELVKKKVKLLSLMAGAFVPIDGNAHFGEYNVARDIPSCQQLVAQWPTPMVFSGFEIGIALPYPSESILRDFGYVKHHPAAESYILYEPPPHNRPTWDLTSVLYAVLGDRGYFDVSPRGKVTVSDKAVTSFAPDPAGPHAYLILKPEQRSRVVEALVQLSSQPPCIIEGPRP
ncbi:nucleoside hydrolase [Aquisphaera insulae]|uniref:nucleoside hydrolase n=1 Tax=Aquisphaera insulae TaxID=2712864 RepID=UPI0013EDA70C|nr:nucleoside hydrolase [Aquisphaera insulae]